MDFKGQTALLSVIFGLVGMMFLVPAITEKALAGVDATAKGVCGPEGQTNPCEFTLVTASLTSGTWGLKPTESGTVVHWKTGAGAAGGFSPGDEKGSVTYYVDKEKAVLSFDNPVFGSNKCSISGPWISEARNSGSCTAGKGMNAEFTYNLHQLNPYYGTTRPPATTPENHTAS